MGSRGAHVEVLDDACRERLGCCPVDEPPPRQPLPHHTRQKRVFNQTHVRCRRMAQPLFGCGHQPCPPPVIRPRIAHGHPRNLHRAGGTAQFARQRQQKFVLPVARNPGNPQHFTLADGKPHILQRGAKRNGRGHRQPRNLKRNLSLGPPRAHRGRQHCPHHQFGHLTRRPVARGAGRHDAAPAQDRRLVAKAADLLQLVADIQDRGPLCRQLPQGLEQDAHLLRGQHRCRFIHDQKLGVLQQTADDLDPLPFARGQVAHHPAGVKGQPISLGNLTDAPGQRLHGWRAFHPEGHIFRHVQRFEQAEVLEHHRHALPPRLGRFCRCIGLAAQGHPATVRAHKAVDHLDQRGLPSPVLPKKRVNLALADLERHIRVGDNAGIGLCHPLDAEKQLGHALFLC